MLGGAFLVFAAKRSEISLAGRRNDWIGDFGSTFDRVADARGEHTGQVSLAHVRKTLVCGHTPRRYDTAQVDGGPGLQTGSWRSESVVAYG